MLHILMTIIMIEFIVCFIVDVSGVTYYIKKAIMKHLFKMKDPQPDQFTMKPFDCSLCMTFWISMIYIIIVHSFTIPSIAICCLAAMTSQQMTELIWLAKDLIQTPIDLLKKLMTKTLYL